MRPPLAIVPSPPKPPLLCPLSMGVLSEEKDDSE